MRKRAPRMAEKCEKCGKKMRRTVEKQYPYLEGGLSKVVLNGIVAFVCECGEKVVALPNVELLHALIAERLLAKPGPLRGEEVRFLRKSMSIKSVDFAKMLRVHPTTLSKWESGDQAISQEHDRLIRFAVVVTVSSRAKKQVADAHSRIADQYLELFGQIQAADPGNAESETIEITQQDMAEPPLTFRWGLSATPTVELVE